MAIHAFFLFPETGGKTLEEVEDMFLSKQPAWKTRVEFHRVRAVERGEVDPEKISTFQHKQSVSSDTPEKA